MIRLRVGMVAPAALSVTITPADPSLDMTTVTAVAFFMRRPDGSTKTLGATIQGGATASSLVAQYTWASDASDLPIPGAYTFDPVLTVPGGTIYGLTIDAVCSPPGYFTRVYP